MATGVILSWRRLWNLPKIVASMHESGCFDEICLVQNDCGAVFGGIPQAVEFFKGSGLKLVLFDSNLYTYARWKAIDKIKQHVGPDSLVGTTDDDLVVRNWRELFEAKKPWKATIGLDKGHYGDRDAKKWIANGDTFHMSLVGFGAVFEADLFEPAFRRYRSAYGEDCLLLRKADRIATALLGREHDCMIANVKYLDGFASKDALHKLEDHKVLNRLVFERCQKISFGSVPCTR